MHRFLIAPIAALALWGGSLLSADKPNVILIITDDQGYGDIGAHGNSVINTPNLDQLHGESVRLTNFHVDPTCAPTRSALITGRYSTRTGVWHTVIGRSLLDPREVTVADVFKANGYRTGMFGKWHLGDSYPLRPQDRGFEVTTHHGGGGVGQTPDFWGNDYFDDTYAREDGTFQQYDGYCTDVWFDEALKFVEHSKDAGEPFFCYLATNAPHGPYLVADKYRDPYLAAGVPEPMASFYGMITNFDENVGRLRNRLDELSLTDNTILIYMTDNGTAAGANAPRAAAANANAWQGFNAGMRGQKGSEYDGGHRVPFFVHWPAGGLTTGRDVDLLSAHVDVLPTLAEVCGLQPVEGTPLDGSSLAKVVLGTEAASSQLQQRTLLVHSQRLENVEKWRKSAVMTQRWRLINGTELYDIVADPGQTSDIAGDHADVVATLRQSYEEWWTSLSPAFGEYVHVGLGSPHEQQTHLTCHDWHGNGDESKLPPWHQAMVAKDPQFNGDWAVEVIEPGRYEFTLRRRPEGFEAPLGAGTARIRIAGAESEQPVKEGAPHAVLTLELPAGRTRLETWLDSSNGESRGAYFVDVRKLP